MHIWLDIDNSKHIAFYKEVIAELKQRGHKIIITALDTKEIKIALKENNICADFVNYVIPFIKNPSFDLILLRTLALGERIKDRKINVGFSAWSLDTLYTCTSVQIPVITYLNNLGKKLDETHTWYDKSYLIVSPLIHDYELIENNINLSKVKRCKRFSLKDLQYTQLKSIKEIVNGIEQLSNKLSTALVA